MTTTETAHPRTEAATPTDGASRGKGRNGSNDVELGTIDFDLLSALSDTERPPRPGALSTSITHGWRALLKIKHVPEQLLDITLFPVMMLLMFTYLFGGAIEGSTGDYLQYLLPGLVVTSVLMITMYTGVGLSVDAEKGVFDRFRSLPMWRPSAIVGALLGDAVRYSAAAMVMITLGIALGFRPDSGGGLGIVAAIALLLVFSFSLSWIWTTLGLLLRGEKAVMNTSMMILFPLTFLSNVFVDTETLPGWLQGVVDLNPITLMVTAVRGLMHGDPGAGDITVALLVSAGFVALFAPITMRLYRTKV